METRQPNWELIANLGDTNPLDYGGYFIYRDTTGVYSEEGEKLFVDENESGDVFTVHRFSLDRLKLVQDEKTGVTYLAPLRYEASWPHPLSQYDEWFNKDLNRVADFIGQTVIELREAFCSENPLDRAHAYQAIGDYHGYVNLDSYPLTFNSRTEVEERYKAKNPA